MDFFDVNIWSLSKSVENMFYNQKFGSFQLTDPNYTGLRIRITIEHIHDNTFCLYSVEIYCI